MIRNTLEGAAIGLAIVLVSYLIGGSIRESETKFWIDLCREFQLPYTVVADKNRTEFVSQDILSHLEYDLEACALSNYERR